MVSPVVSVLPSNYNSKEAPMALRVSGCCGRFVALARIELAHFLLASGISKTVSKNIKKK